ncbi:TetR/AcrR family transcriptional regulator [Streptomyces sp. NBC_01724]|uniref:TetR/AcrR family transcriptional regulator n=1 Tax=unclassified Streptomyces TaxID=2593676 RepID=UPI002E3448EB|nr:TetR/AcrR family transcriptional regulator [Streptomyces sp. NBC_01724]WTE56083.1 TetR/AcrR family transcriptional regulator [Streptomyces sp. NBC_01620]WTE64157.1 TetR/AcrR family transcriptional regulator [Streptomyces sp. NBC_01617]WTI91444.1 TetR/AcrR family transcriptional regulator [Streptomyces sp. NBC_00724]
MTTSVTPRERLLQAAGELFYRDGMNIGVDALCKAAGVSKKSMYQLFRSKDEVIAESLASRGPTYQAALLPSPDDERSPREHILTVFERQDRMTAEGNFLGCPFVSAAVELKDPEHPGSVVARRFKQHLTDFFRAELVAAEAEDPESLAVQLTIVFDGASARAVVRSQALAGIGVATAAALLDAAGVEQKAPTARPTGARIGS